jgi:hypothetical protein
VRNPFYEGLRPDWLFTIVELEPVLPRLEELQRKTLERLRLSGGTIERVTFFRHSIFYPKNRKLLVEVRVENPSQENGRVVFDLQGAVVDVVGGPSSEDSGGTKAVGLTDVTPERVSAFEALAVSHEDLLKKYHDALWDKTWASAPAKLFKLPRSDFQQWAACQRDLLANVEKILNVYAEKKPPSDEIASTRLASHTRQRQFWEAERQYWDASCRQTKLFDTNWTEWTTKGFPEEANRKPWHQEIVRLEGERDAALKRISELKSQQQEKDQ